MQHSMLDNDHSGKSYRNDNNRLDGVDSCGVGVLSRGMLDSQVACDVQTANADECQSVRTMLGCSGRVHDWCHRLC